MKILSIMAAVAAFFTFCEPAAAEGLYVGVTAGQSVEAQADGFDLDDGSVVGLSAGMSFDAFSLPLRVQGAARRVHTSTDLGFAELDGTAMDYSVSLFYDLNVSKHFTMFGGGGLNYAVVDADLGPWFSDQGEGQGRHAAVGAAIAATDRLTVEGEWRRTWLEPEFDHLNARDLEFDSATITARYALN